MKTYTNPIYEYRPSVDQIAGKPVHHPIIVVGAGPVGLTAAIDMAQHAVPVVLLDEDNTVSVGSRAICYAKRSLEIFDRLGCGEPVVQKGVGWNVGKVFFKERLVYSFNLLPEHGHHRPAFVNLQQYYLEEILVRRAEETERVDMRWRSRVVGVDPGPSGVSISVETPDGVYALTCDWLIACDGARSPIRHMMGLMSKGQVFRDHFLITDVLMEADYPTERWFWFDPPFNPGRSALLHRQADNVWRVDLQLGRDVNLETEKQPERVLPRLKQMLGERRFDLEWASIYTFTCRRMDKFRYGRVLFAGDAAHQVSPFGARGANSGMQDADNLVWKLKLVMGGKAPERLLDTYSEERVVAAEENIVASTRSTEFITPGSKVSCAFRDAVLLLAERHLFARELINSGRLSVPATLRGSPLNKQDSDTFSGGLVPGTPAADAPVAADDGRRWLLECLGGSFNGIYFASGVRELEASLGRGITALMHDRIPVLTALVVERGNPLVVPAGTMRIEDSEGLATRRFDGLPGTFYLLRPDQHVCARWRRFDPEQVRKAVARATCND